MAGLPIPPLLSVVIDRQGGAAVRAENAFADPAPDGALLWQHLYRDAPRAAAELAASGLDSFVLDALTAKETRPRCTVHGSGVVLNLRGVNLNPGAGPEDMVSVRLWLEAGRIFGVWLRPLQAVEDLLGAMERGQAPTTPGEFVARLALRLADRAEPVVATLNEKIDTLEEQVLDQEAGLARGDLAEVHRSAIILRRFMQPQRDALTTLEIEDLDWLTERDRSRLREAAERVQRLSEDLDAIRDRAQVVRDQIMEMRSDQMNRRMLVLSIVAAVFLPLGLLTGLLGINVGGMPGAGNPWAFWIVTGGLVALGGGLVWWVWRLGMFR